MDRSEIRRVLEAAYRAAPGGLGVNALLDGLTDALVALRDRKAPLGELVRRAAHFAGWEREPPPADESPLPPTLPTGKLIP